MHRDTLLIVLGLLVAIVLGALLLNYGNMHPSGSQPAAVSFSVIAEGEQAGDITKRVNYRIRSEAEFAALWSALHKDDEMPLPVVDFDAHDVLAVFEGEKSSGGYDVSVVSVVDAGNGALSVTILHEEPGTSCFTTEVITSPFELVVVPKTDAKISHEDLTTIRECE